MVSIKLTLILARCPHLWAQSLSSRITPLGTSLFLCQTLCKLLHLSFYMIIFKNSSKDLHARWYFSVWVFVWKYFLQFLQTWNGIRTMIRLKGSNHYVTKNIPCSWLTKSCQNVPFFVPISVVLWFLLPIFCLPSQTVHSVLWFFLPLFCSNYLSFYLLFRYYLKIIYLQIFITFSLFFVHLLFPFGLSFCLGLFFSILTKLLQSLSLSSPCLYTAWSRQRCRLRI